MDDTDCLPCTVDADCDDGNICTQDACVSNQCEHDSTPLEGTGCDDGQYCTVLDSCTSGVCGGPARDCSYLGDACHEGYCNDVADACEARDKPNGTGCDDGEYCTDPDTCTAGVCGGFERDCSDGDDCTEDTCDEDNDECDHVLQPLPGAEGWSAGAATCGNGVDDDCDLQTDLDDSDCCQAECTGRECGPDPVCSYFDCGPCLADETCWSGTCMKGEWVTVNSGGQSFTMGSPSGENGRDGDEGQHQVTFTRDYLIWSVEVTQEWFEAVMGYNPSSFSSCGDDCPVEMVSWHESAAFCNELSEAEGLAKCYECTGTAPNFSCDLDPVHSSPYECPGYRLPTEAEWEYAARSGTTTATYNGDLDADHTECEPGNTVLEPIAWFCVNSGDRTHEAATRDPSDWGLYDMPGNVWEWCQDWYGGYQGDETDPWGPPTAGARADRRVRGGSWNYGADDCRAANRTSRGPGDRANYMGFRPVRSR
jgi:formylglycine-generating enzyme required for sulfatase activity